MVRITGALRRGTILERLSRQGPLRVRILPRNRELSNLRGDGLPLLTSSRRQLPSVNYNEDYVEEMNEEDLCTTPSPKPKTARVPNVSCKVAGIDDLRYVEDGEEECLIDWKKSYHSLRVLSKGCKKLLDACRDRTGKQLGWKPEDMESDSVNDFNNSSSGSTPSSDDDDSETLLPDAVREENGVLSNVDTYEFKTEYPILNEETGRFYLPYIHSDLEDAEILPQAYDLETFPNDNFHYVDPEIMQVESFSVSESDFGTIPVDGSNRFPPGVDPDQVGGDPNRDHGSKESGDFDLDTPDDGSNRFPPEVDPDQNREADRDHCSEQRADENTEGSFSDISVTSGSAYSSDSGNTTRSGVSDRSIDLIYVTFGKKVPTKGLQGGDTKIRTRTQAACAYPGCHNRHMYPSYDALKRRHFITAHPEAYKKGPK